MKSRLLSYLDLFPKANIAIIGDLILDRFWLGEVERLSPEAPVPVLSITEEINALGGAANVAANIKTLGGQVSLLGVVGSDEDGRFLLDLLKKQDISIDNIFVSPSRITPCKTRVIGRGSLPQHIVRIDKERIGLSLNKNIKKEIVKRIKNKIDDSDLVVVSDYAKDSITSKVAKLIIETSNFKKKKVVVDTKPNNFNYYKNVYLFAPNTKEALEIAGISNLRKAGKIIQKITNSNVLITRGGDGMTIFQKNKVINLKAKERKVFDPVGAGDTMMASLALSLAAGASLKDAADIANHAAGIVVTKRGTAVVSVEELREDLLK